MKTDRAATLAVIVAALGYFVDIYDLILFGTVRKASLIDIVGGGIPAIWEGAHWRTAYFVGGGMGLALLVLRIGVTESGMFRATSLRRSASTSTSSSRKPSRGQRGIEMFGIRPSAVAPSPLGMKPFMLVEFAPLYRKIS